ncbi:hypothetical protein Tsubulata_013705 [Turnera subulata]|uniref:BHLH domain-containing protein n=1 Tax=Turnera subulata TaxID=218843 RepID=A0A9Q0GB22_9ROSI|nr:hypothetical protein Tsubulata_013705 [Turnera subulata]
MASSGDNNDGLGFHKRDESAVICPSSGMSTGPFFPSAWDPVVSLSQNENFGGSSSIVSQGEFSASPYTVALENQGIPSSSHLLHYPSDSSFGGMVTKFPSFGSGSFSEMVGSLGLTDCSQIASIPCPPNYTSNRESHNERSVPNSGQTQEDNQFSAETTMGASPYGKRRKRGAESSSPSLPDKDVEGMVQKDSSAEISPKEQDEKKLKVEQNSNGANLKSKQTAKQAKDTASSGEGTKDNYIHVRARRGQATNSHSLAERVRREKISERMRMLQELVPGCNKITGKAVMLDEIINYVQSLQQQVEFLSMKLATVNPELNIDLERILSKDMLHSRGGSAAILGFNPGMNSQPYSHGILPPGVPVMPNSNHQILPSPHTLLDNDFQTLFQMGYNSSSAMDNLGGNGHLKPEL